MSKLLMGVQRRENCLLESPTGTGKTLALLSAALAWQRQQREHALAMESDGEVEEDDEPTINDGPQEPLQTFEDFRYVEPKSEGPVELAYEVDSAVTTKGKKNQNPPPNENEETGPRFYGDDFDDDVFESPKKKRQRAPAPKPRARSPRMDSEGGACASDLEVDSSPEDLDSPASYPSGGREADLGTAEAESKPAAKPIKQEEKKPQKLHKAKKRRRVPRVFFCSRTHSQLNQVVAELRTCRTAFEDTSVVGVGEDDEPFRMTLLASRKSTCINKEGEVPSMPLQVPYTRTHCRYY